MSKQENKLLPCPFCGSFDAPLIREGGSLMVYGNPGEWIVVCDASSLSGLGGCGASCGYQLTQEEAALAWNRRVKAAGGAS